MQRAQQEAAGAAAPASSLQPVLLGDMPVGGEYSEAGPGSLPLAEDFSHPEDLNNLLATMDMMLPMLDNPALLRNMPPEQAKKIKQLGGAVKDIKSKVQSGKPISQKEMEGLTQKVQQLSMEMMQAMPAAMQPPPARGKKQ